MSLPVRCFTCGSVIGNLEQKFIDHLENGLEKKEFLDNMNVRQICCRRMFLGYENIIDKLNVFPKHIDNRYGEKKYDDT